jgi:hypothetical protein
LWTGVAIAHAAADLVVLSKIVLPNEVFVLYQRIHSSCLKLQASQRGHLIRKKWQLGPSCQSTRSLRSAHITQQLASQAISTAALQVTEQSLPSLPYLTVSTAKLSLAALQLLAAHRAWHSTAMTEALLAGTLPVHPAGFLRFPKALINPDNIVGVERQKALIELKRLVNRISRFLRGCMHRQTSVAVAAAMSIARRSSSRSSEFQSLDLYPIQFPAGISHILLKSFSSGFKLHSAVRALLSDMRSNLAAASLLLKRPPLHHSKIMSHYRCNTNVIAICATSLPQLRRQSRSVASFVRLQFCHDTPQGHSRLHLAPLAYNPGITRNQQVAALCFGQPIQGGWRNDQTHAQWLQRHWVGLAVAGALYAMQDSQLFQMIVTVDRVLMGNEATSKAATRSSIAAAHAAEASMAKPASDMGSRSTLRDASSEFLLLCARVAGRRSSLYAALPPRDSPSASSPAIYLQNSLLLFNDLNNNFLFQLTQRQRCLLVTSAYLASFHIFVAVVHIQRCTRGHSARRTASAAMHLARLKQHLLCQDAAASMISRFVRLCWSRRILRGLFAMRLQRLWRGHVIRKVLNKTFIKLKIKNAAAKRLQRNWKGHMIQRWFLAARSVATSRSVVHNDEKDDATFFCVRNPLRIWSHASSQYAADFISGYFFRNLFPFLLCHQRQWVSAYLLRQRNSLLIAQSETFALFMAKATSEAEAICLSQVCRAWKRHCCSKHVRSMLCTRSNYRLFASKQRASALLQQAWRSRCSRLDFLVALKNYRLDRQQRGSDIIVRNVLCCASRRLLQHMRRSAAACALQRRFRLHAAASRMSALIISRQEEALWIRHEVAAARLQSAVRGWRSRQMCLRGAASIAAHMLSWNLQEQRYDTRLRLAIVISRHRPYSCSDKCHNAHLPSNLCLEHSSSTVNILRHVARSCCSSVSSRIAEWGFKRIRNEKNRCHSLAQIYARHTVAVLLLQAAYRSHMHRRKHFKPFLPSYRAAVMLQRRVTAATRIQCLWRSSVARLGLACVSALAMKGRWITRNRWAHSRAKQALLPSQPPAAEPSAAARLPAKKNLEWNFFDAKLNGWCCVPNSFMHSLLSPDDSVAIRVAASASFHLCERIEGFVGQFPSSDRFFGGDSNVASFLQQIESVCPQITARCWDSVCNVVPKDAAAFASDPTLNPAHVILSYFRQFVSGMLAQSKSARERDVVLFRLRGAAGARAAFAVHLPPSAAGSLRRMLLHSSTAVLSSLHWLFTRWGNAELMGDCHARCSFMFPVSHDAEFVHECHGVWSMLLQCHLRPILFCLEMLVSSMSRQLFELLNGADAALICSAISALLMLMSFWLQTSFHPQHRHCESSMWILFSACSLEAKYVAAYLDESLRSNSASIHLNVIQLLHASVHEHAACVLAALGQQAESLASLMRAENLLSQLSSSSINSRSASDQLHGPPSPSEQLCWRELAQASLLLFDCFGGSSSTAQAAAVE